MKRPDIEKLRDYVRSCCGKMAGKVFCESFDCSTIRNLTDYILYLEKRHLTRQSSGQQKQAVIAQCNKCGLEYYSHMAASKCCR
uniref:Uncharacterized protein n=1 Tax=viral metagenome TaxID=1070528 RepID=A0A6M3JM64_9ZZZZ